MGWLPLEWFWIGRGASAESIFIINRTTIEWALVIFKRNCSPFLSNKSKYWIRMSINHVHLFFSRLLQIERINCVVCPTPPPSCSSQTSSSTYLSYVLCDTCSPSESPHCEQYREEEKKPPTPLSQLAKKEEDERGGGVCVKKIKILSPICVRVCVKLIWFMGVTQRTFAVLCDGLWGSLLPIPFFSCIFFFAIPAANGWCCYYTPFWLSSSSSSAASCARPSLFIPSGSKYWMKHTQLHSLPFFCT